MYRAFEYHFEWDPAKARKNLRKHRIAFERAATIFGDPKALSRFDDERGRLEERWVTMGIDRNGIILVVVHAFREELGEGARVRLISARKAIKNQMKQYEHQRL